jgi:voltage-gated potassium channel
MAKIKLRHLTRNLSFKFLLYFLVIIIVSSTLLYVFDKTDEYGKVRTFFDSLWWTFVTITTVGYGDIVPTSFIGKIVAILTMILGIGFVGFISGKIASFLVEKTIKEGKGIMDIETMKNHVVIAGWKKEMEKVLKELLAYDSTSNLENIVIIANISADELEIFRQQYPEFKDLKILRGEHFNENMLAKVNVGDASKILILADDSKTSSLTEIDSKTVMAAMAARNISKKVNICAELLNRNFESHLKNLFIDEIIYTGDYSRMLITSALFQDGAIKVINNLLDSTKPSFISIKTFPEDFIGKEYSSLKRHFEQTSHNLLIGLLENAGGFLERKKEALNEAQKTPDISQLIENLTKVKSIENNTPFLNPPNDYIVLKNSKAILTETRR